MGRSVTYYDHRSIERDEDNHRMIYSQEYSSAQISHTCSNQDWNQMPCGYMLPRKLSQLKANFYVIDM